MATPNASGKGCGATTTRGRGTATFYTRHASLPGDRTLQWARAYFFYAFACSRENIRRFFASYREACARADRLLLKIRDNSYIRGAMRNSVGKMTPTALYVHRRAVGHMPVVLRLYEHCGVVAVAGRPVDYEILKLAHGGRQVSWLGYPEFDTDPRPHARGHTP